MTDVNRFPNIKILASPHRFPMEEYLAQGYDVTAPFKGTSFLARLVRYFWFKLGLPNAKMWFRDIDATGIDLIVMHEWVYGAAYLEWLRTRLPDKRICYLYSNRITVPQDVAKIKALDCGIWSWDLEDCKQYDLGFMPTNGYPYLAPKEPSTADCDVFFIGKDKGRADKLLGIKGELEALGLKTDFHITADVSYKRFSHSFYKAPISYDEVVEKVKRSKAILHLADGAQRGVTLRISESIIFGVKLITNYKEIRDYDFYNENNIFIVHGDGNGGGGNSGVNGDADGDENGNGNGGHGDVNGYENGGGGDGNGGNWSDVPAFLAKPYVPLSDDLMKKYSASGLLEGLLRGGF